MYSNDKRAEIRDSKVDFTDNVKRRTMRKRTKSREMALKILYAWEITHKEMKDCRMSFLENYPEKEDLLDLDDFLDTLVFGVEANITALDAMITKYATNWRLERMASIDRNVLRLAAFELLYLPDVPPKVTINEAIEMAKKYGDTDSGKFVNGILDSINKHEELNKNVTEAADESPKK